MIDLTDKVVLITGGSRGIGAATARPFAAAGARVAITYRARRDDAAGVVAASGGKAKAIAIQAELGDAASNQKMVEETTRAFGRLDYFVANAGIWPVEDIPVSRMSDDHWSRTIR